MEIEASFIFYEDEENVIAQAPLNIDGGNEILVTFKTEDSEVIFYKNDISEFDNETVIFGYWGDGSENGVSYIFKKSAVIEEVLQTLIDCTQTYSDEDLFTDWLQRHIPNIFIDKF